MFYLKLISNDNQVTLNTNIQTGHIYNPTTQNMAAVCVIVTGSDSYEG